MASFEISYYKTLNIEGGYANHPNDKGGETYKGIARNYHLDWQGWILIDQLKRSPGFPRNIDQNQDLQSMVKKFYKNKFWDVFQGDRITNQEIADELFDTGVNMGPGRAVEFLQVALNALNRRHSIYQEISEDGAYGYNTNNALEAYLRNDDPVFLLKLMNILQGYHYLKLTRKDESQEVFMRGWLKRVEITKKSNDDLFSHSNNIMSFKRMGF